MRAPAPSPVRACSDPPSGCATRPSWSSARSLVEPSTPLQNPAPQLEPLSIGLKCVESQLLGWRRDHRRRGVSFSGLAYQVYHPEQGGGEVVLTSRPMRLSRSTSSFKHPPADTRKHAGLRFGTSHIKYAITFLFCIRSTTRLRLERVESAPVAQLATSKNQMFSGFTRDPIQNDTRSEGRLPEPPL